MADEIIYTGPDKQWLIAGIKVILKRSLVEWGMNEEAMHVPASLNDLLGMAVRLEAPVDEQVKRWRMFAEGKPDLSDGQRALMVKQAGVTELLLMKARGGKIQFGQLEQWSGA